MKVEEGTLPGGLDWRRAPALDPDVVRLLEAKSVCVVSTIGPSGRIQSTPVWVDTDGRHVLLNGVDGRAWVRNLDRDPNVTLLIVMADNPYEFAEVRGRVVERTEAGANDHIHRLAAKYLGLEEYPWLEAGGQRVLFRVEPERVYSMRPSSPEIGGANG